MDSSMQWIKLAAHRLLSIYPEITIQHYDDLIWWYDSALVVPKVTLWEIF